MFIPSYKYPIPYPKTCSKNLSVIFFYNDLNWSYDIFKNLLGFVSDYNKLTKSIADSFACFFEFVIMMLFLL